MMNSNRYYEATSQERRSNPERLSHHIQVVGLLRRPSGLLAMTSARIYSPNVHKIPSMSRFLLQFSFVLFLSGTASGCVARSSYVYYHPEVTHEGPVFLLEKVKEIEKQNFDNVKLETIAKNELSTHHLVIIKKEEPLHIHAAHDGWAICLKGKGEFVIGDKKFPIHPGSSVFIPRGVPHKAIRRGREPIAAFVIFTPPYDGLDTVLVEKNLSRIK